MTSTQLGGMFSPESEESRDGPRYLPILKARQGELRALEELVDPRGSDLTPIIELVEVDFESLSPREAAEQRRKLVAKIARAWPPGRPRVIIDTTGIEVDPETVILQQHAEPVSPELVTPALLGELQMAGIRAVPVVRLSDPEAFTAAVMSDVAGAVEPGVCLRISGEDLDDQVVPLDQAVEDLLQALQLQADVVDLVLDFGPIADENTLGMAARLARFVLPTLQGLPWRSFAVAAGAFPVNLTEVAAYQLAELPRHDRQLWHQLSGFRLDRGLDYSDYAVTHPLLHVGVAFAAPPQIRYTTSNAWLVMKGRRSERRGHAQIFDLCGRLLRDRPEDIAPAQQSWGDSWFHEAAQWAGAEDVPMGPGNASTWRAVATSHHLGHVLHGLRSRGDP
jgi:hypothetical protein